DGLGFDSAGVICTEFVGDGVFELAEGPDLVGSGDRSCQAARSYSWIRRRGGRGERAAHAVALANASRLCSPVRLAEGRASGAADAGCNGRYRHAARIRAGGG